MEFCGECGTKMDEGVKFCPGCGAAAEIPVQQGAQQSDFSAKLQDFNNTADTSAQYNSQDVTSNKAMAILAYLGPLVLIPWLAAKDSRFARFHANQGLVLCIASIAFSIVYSILSAIILAISWRLTFIVTIIGLIGLVFMVLAIIGIINAANGRAKELPLIGKIRILK